MKSISAEKRLHVWEGVLQEHDLRLTKARQTVMDILAGSKTSLTAQEIYDLARERGRSVGIASVYRTLEVLADLNLIQQIHQSRSCQAYAPALSGHQHFVICKECGRMIPFAGREELEEFFREVEERSGYQVQEHWLQLFGLCQACQS